MDATFKSSHFEEQECLFYVALSRARNRLFLYAPTKMRNGAKRSRSAFLDRLGSKVTGRHVHPHRSRPEPPEDLRVAIAFEGTLRYDASQIPLYESCPRRFFYTHVLRIGGRRTTTAFMRMHEATRRVMKDVRDGTSGLRDLDRAIAIALDAEGLGHHGYLEDYRKLATAMLSFFATAREDLAPEVPTILKVAIGGGEITVSPDDVLLGPTGDRILRRVRTGHIRSDEAKDLGSAAFLAAVRQTFPDAEVELLHLADETRTPIQFKGKELENRTTKITAILAKIRAGDFPTAPSTRRCPSCPAFFVCGPVPAGSLRRQV